MLRRRRPLLRGAVVAGGAYAAGKHVANKQAEQQAEAYEAGAEAAAPPAEAPAAPAGGLSEAAMQQLQQLAQLKEQGILTEEEFEAQKAKILAGS